MERMEPSGWKKSREDEKVYNAYDVGTFSLRLHSPHEQSDIPNYVNAESPRALL